MASAYSAHATMAFAVADSALRSAIQVAESSLGPSHIGVAAPLSALGRLYTDMGRYEEAERLCRRAVDIVERAYGPDDVRTADFRHDLADVLFQRGDYIGAEKMHRGVLRLQEHHRGPADPSVARTLISLARVMHSRRHFLEAERLSRRALAIYETEATDSVPDIADATAMLATSLRGQGDYDEAESLYQEALTLTESAYSREHVRTVCRLNELAALYVNIRQWDKAESYAREALTIAERILPDGHLQVSRSVLYLGAVKSARARYDDAAPLYERALAIRRRVLGEYHPDVAGALGFLSGNEYLRGDFEKSMEYDLSAAEIRIGNYIRNSAHLTDYDAVLFEYTVYYTVSSLLSAYVNLPSPEPHWAERVADLILRVKGTVPEDLLARQQFRLRADNRDIENVVSELSRVRAEKSRLYYELGAAAKNTVPWALDSLTTREEELESALSDWGEGFRRSRLTDSVSADQVARVLPDNTVLVEYYRFTCFDRTPEAREMPRLIAVVVDRSGVRGVRDLGDTRALDQTVSEYHNQMALSPIGSSGAILADHSARQNHLQILYDRIWRPIADLTGDRENVLIAPDANLNRVSFAALMDDAGEFLIERHTVHYVPSGRFLLRFDDKRVGADRLFVLGNPDFDATASERWAALATDSVEYPDSGTATVATRNVRAVCDDLRRMEALPLPGTGLEVESISRRWELRRGAVSKFTGASASEDALFRSAPGSRVVHLSTHGFYLPDECQEPASQDELWEPNAFLHCGLLFAGANLHGRGADEFGIADGILSASEITSLDLSGTQMVVLSACESGLGDAARGQAVFDLRLAFLLAGARSVVCSLWPISDRTTVDLMERIYAGTGESVAQILRSYALETIRRSRMRNQFPDPQAWAAFVTIGDWPPPSGQR